MSTKLNTTAAKALGAIAFARGIAASPALDKDMAAMFVGRQVGDSRTIPEMKAWIAGWTQANLASA